MKLINIMFLFKEKRKKEQLLNEEDLAEIKEIQRKAYMEEAKILALQKGKEDAKKDFNKSKEVNNLW
jgi:hypothetical protein